MYSKYIPDDSTHGKGRLAILPHLRHLQICISIATGGSCCLRPKRSLLLLTSYAPLSFQKYLGPFAILFALPKRFRIFCTTYGPKRSGILRTNFAPKRLHLSHSFRHYWTNCEGSYGVHSNLSEMREVPSSNQNRAIERDAAEVAL